MDYSKILYENKRFSFFFKKTLYSQHMWCLEGYINNKKSKRAEIGIVSTLFFWGGGFAVMLIGDIYWIFMSSIAENLIFNN